MHYSYALANKPGSAAPDTACRPDSRGGYSAHSLNGPAPAPTDMPGNEDPDLRTAFEEILDKARRSPSGVNVQPWQLVVPGPQHLAKLSQAVERNVEHLVREARQAWPSLSETDLRGQFRALAAPLFALCLIDERLGAGSELDYGMFVQNIRLLASARGLEAQVWPAWSIASQLAAEWIPMENHRILCALTVATGRPSAALSATRVQTKWVA